jgi:hypothetical protein
VGEQRVSNLERRYRLLLKVLPRWYRDGHEEEMVGLFLADRTDELGLEHGWPGWKQTGVVLGLAVRTHFAAGAARADVPMKVASRGEIVRALGVIGLVLGVFHAGASIASTVYAYQRLGVLGGPTWMSLFDVLPIVAFVALLAGKRTTAKLAAFAALVLAAIAIEPHVGSWLLFQLPSLVTFVALCLGFHREAPTPPARRLAWWGGGALLAGMLGGPALGAFLVPVVVVVVRVVAFVRGDFVLGRALSVFAVLELTPLVFLLAMPGLFEVALVLVVLLVITAVAPVRRVRTS